MKDYTVVSSTPTKNGNFCTKIQNVSRNSQVTAFGNVEGKSQETYYFFTQVQPAIGFKAQMDVNLFDIVNKKFTTEDDGDITLKYLYPKRAS